MFIQFGMTNTRSEFWEYIYNTITQAIDDLQAAYLDDVLIYTASENKQIGNTEWIMQQFLEAGLYWRTGVCK